MIGQVEFSDGDLVLYIDNITLSKGTLNFFASGDIDPENLPSGVVNFSLYGSDLSLIAVGKYDSTEDFRWVRTQKVTHLELQIPIDIETLRFNQ